MNTVMPKKLIPFYQKELEAAKANLSSNNLQQSVKNGGK